MENQRTIQKQGTILLNVYKEPTSGLPIFYINADNEDVLPVVDVLEDTLKKY